jgi:hypothetical protein
MMKDTQGMTAHVMVGRIRQRREHVGNREGIGNATIFFR